jgi:hypothetical protein
MFAIAEKQLDFNDVPSERLHQVWVKVRAKQDA